jgi:dihydroflavonol-4-reductase
MPVLVTGATGHIGNNLCRILAEDNRPIRAMVRSTSPTSILRDVGVETVEANLLVPESLEDAMDDCDVVFHAAAVYRTWSDNPELEIIKPAVEGTRNVLEAARKKNVRKIIYASSVVAIGGGDSFDHGRNEDDWNDDATLPYNIAKTRAEKLAHELADELDLNVIYVLPGMVLGPNDFKITPSNGLVRDFLNGKIPFFYDSAFTIVDVRDVARGMLLAEQHGQRGERYILGGQQVTVKELFDQLAEMTTRSAPAMKLGAGTAKVSSYPMKWLSKLFGNEPMITPEIVEDQFGKYHNFSSAKAIEKLGYEHRSLLRVLEDSINWLIKQNEVSPDIRTVENT